MLNLMVRVSRYLITALLVLYTILDFYYFTKKTESGKNSVVSVQSFLMYTLQFLFTVILFAFYEDITIVILYVASLLVFIIYQSVYPAIYKRADRHLLNNVMFLVMIGLTIQARLKLNKATKQLILLIVAAVITLLVPKILDNAKKYLYRWTWFYGLCVSNAFTALSGCLLAQYNKSVNIDIGSGMVTIALASLLIGNAFLGRGSIPLKAVGAVLGAFIFRLVYTIALRLRMPAFMLKAVSSCIVIIAISAPYFKSQWPMLVRRWNLRKGGVDHAG